MLRLESSWPYYLEPTAQSVRWLRYVLDNREIEVRSTVRVKDVSIVKASGPAVGSTQPPIQCVFWVEGGGVAQSAYWLDYGLDGQEFASRQRQETSLKHSDRFRRSIRRLPRFSSKVMQPGRKAHHPTRPKLKNEWSYTSTPQYAFAACTDWNFYIPTFQRNLLLVTAAICALALCRRDKSHFPSFFSSPNTVFNIS